MSVWLFWAGRPLRPPFGLPAKLAASLPRTMPLHPLLARCLHPFARPHSGAICARIRETFQMSANLDERLAPSPAETPPPETELSTLKAGGGGGEKGRG